MAGQEEENSKVEEQNQGQEGRDERLEGQESEKVREIPVLNVPFSATLNKTSGTITFVHVDGRSYSILSSHRSYESAKEILTKIDETVPDSPEELELRDQLFQLTIPASRVTKYGLGDIKVENGKVFFRDRVVHNVVADRIIWMLDHDEDIKVMVRFLDNLMQNPSYRAVQEVYRFLEANKMAITRDGMILAYKNVNADFTSIHPCKDGTHLDNTPGSVVNMPRNEVNEDPNMTCSEGLHLAAASYLPYYRNGADTRTVICVCHPKDVVSIPVDYNNAKMRVCEYKVLREITKDENDPLAQKPVWEPEVAA